MGLLSSLQGKVADAAGTDPLSVDAARLRARRRLIGAVVLVAAGVVGFPLLFDTSPRPVPLETPVTVSGRVTAPPPEASSPAAPEPERTRTPVAEPRKDEEATTAGAAASTSPDTSAGVLAEKAEAPVVQPAPVRKPAAAAAVTKPSDEAARALAALEGKPTIAPAPAPAPESSDAAERFVVQVGAFSEAASARTARQRVEKLGLKAYTQVVDTAAGKRIRVRLGPYSQREEADRAAARLKQAGLQPAVLTL